MILQSCRSFPERFMTRRREKKACIERGKKNLEAMIFYHEHHFKPRSSNKQKLLDISARFWYEFHRILLEVVNRDEDQYFQLVREDKTTAAFKAYPNMRMRACSIASNGRTLKISELSEEEVVKTRTLMNTFVDEWLENFKKEVDVN